MKTIYIASHPDAESLRVQIEPCHAPLELNNTPEFWRGEVQALAQALAQALNPEALQLLPKALAQLNRLSPATAALAPPAPAQEEWRQTVRRKGMLTAVGILGAILVNYVPESRMHKLAKQALEDIQS